MRLSVKASLLLTGLVLVLIAATSLFLIASQQRTIKKVVGQQLESEAGSLAWEIRGFVEDAARDIGAVATNLPGKALRTGDQDAIRDFLASQMAQYPYFENGLFVLDRDGRMLADYPPHPELNRQLFVFRDCFQRTITQGKGVVGAPYVSARTGLPVLTMTAPRLSGKGEIEAVVCGSLSLVSSAALSEQRQHKIGRKGYVYVLDADRRFIIHPDTSRILTSPEAGKNEFLDRAVMGFEGLGETRNSNGVPMLIASRHIPRLNWMVLTQMPMEEALSSLRESIVGICLFFLAALILVLPVGVVAMGNIVKPLEGLEKAAQVIAQDLRNQGTLSRPFASSAMDALRRMRSSDEIGKLARAFFHLSVRLKQTLTSLRNAAEDWERTFSSVQEAVLVLDEGGVILRANRVAKDLFRTEAVGGHWREVLSMGGQVPKDWPRLEDIRDPGKYKVTTALPETPGVFELCFSAIQGRRGHKGYLLMVNEVTEKMRAEERIRDLAFHDPLTRLPNRLLLMDRLEQAMATADRNGSRVGVLFLDLDNFKQVNDTFGHGSGDELLKQVADRVGACLRSNDTLARYAGDEFVAVLMDLKDLHDARSTAARMLQSLGEPFDISGRTASIGVSIGIAVYPLDGASANQLLNHADTAMYRAKGQGKNSLWFAETPEMTGGDDLPKQ